MEFLRYLLSLLKKISKSDSDCMMTRLRRKLTLFIYSSAKEALYNDRK